MYKLLNNKTLGKTSQQAKDSLNSEQIWEKGCVQRNITQRFDVVIDKKDVILTHFCCCVFKNNAQIDKKWWLLMKFIGLKFSSFRVTK